MTEVDSRLTVPSTAFKLGSVGRSGAAAIVALGVVNHRACVVSCRGVDGVVGLVTDVDLSVDVSGVRFSVAARPIACQ